ncbi:MAG: phosphoribosyltransferase family protein [Tahibacter sp.]
MQTSRKAHGKYTDPRQAGTELADALSGYRGNPATVVLAIVRGGVPVALEVAQQLALPIDTVVLRALFHWPDSSVVRVVRVAGRLAQAELLAFGMPATDSVEYSFVEDAMNALSQRELECRGLRAPRNLDGQTVILVDNGMRTGGTMQASIAAARELGAAKVVAATPVAASQTKERIEALADETVCLQCPEPFIHVGMWYQKFNVPVDGDISDQLQSFDTRSAFEAKSPQ